MEIKDVENLIALARIAADDTEKAELLKKMNAILEYVSTINQAVSSTDMQGANQVVEYSTVSSQSVNVMREDTVTTEGGYYQSTLVNAAPRHENNFVKVKKILGGGSQ